MGHRTWDVKMPKDVILKLKMPKSKAEEIALDLKWLYRLPQYKREITGVIGGEEHTWETMSLFGPSGAPLRNPETWPADVDAFMAELSANGRVLTLDDLPAIHARRLEIKNLHIPIVDTRQTADDKAAKDAERAELTAKVDAERRAAADAIIAEWGSGETVTVPTGMTAILLLQVYDNSDAMTDYFDRHHGHGPAFLLGMVSGRPAQTEALARYHVAKYPNLSALEWTWHTEKYSMGHGNYLTSVTAPGSRVEGADRPAFSCTWEVVFRVSTLTLGFPAWNGYPGVTVDAPASDPVQGGGNGHGTPRLNADKAGVEIHFSAKPDLDVLTTIKAHGWRWSKYSRCWYAKDTPSARTFAAEITGVPLS